MNEPTAQEQQALIAKQEEEQAIAAYFGAKNADDYAHVDEEDIVLPRIRLLQAKAPECEAGELKPGSVINNVSGSVVIADPKSESIRMIPCFHYNTRIRWWPMDSGEDGFRCRSADGVTGEGDPGGSCKTCPYRKFEDDTAPECKKGLNFVMLFPDGDGADRFALVTFNRTSYSVGKEILNMSRMSEGRMFTNMFELGVQMGSDGKFTWWEWVLLRNDEGRKISKVRDLTLLKAGDNMNQLTKEARKHGTLVVEDESTCESPSGEGMVDDDDVPF
jgi:hypothetical protein